MPGRVLKHASLSLTDARPRDYALAENAAEGLITKVSELTELRFDQANGLAWVKRSTVIGFSREDRCNVCTHMERVCT